MTDGDRCSKTPTVATCSAPYLVSAFYHNGATMPIFLIVVVFVFLIYNSRIPRIPNSRPLQLQQLLFDGGVRPILYNLLKTDENAKNIAAGGTRTHVC